MMLETRKQLECFRLSEIYRWGFKPGMNFYFEAKGTVPGEKGPVYEFTTERGNRISELLTDYAHALLEELGISRKSAKPPPPLPVPSLSQSRAIPVGKGIVSRAVLTGTTWNIVGSLKDEPDFFPLSIETTDGCTNLDHGYFRDLVVVPILDGQGRVIAVLEALNKIQKNFLRQLEIPELDALMDPKLNLAPLQCRRSL